MSFRLGQNVPLWNIKLTLWTGWRK